MASRSIPSRLTHRLAPTPVVTNSDLARYMLTLTKYPGVVGLMILILRSNEVSADMSCMGRRIGSAEACRYIDGHYVQTMRTATSQFLVARLGEIQGRCSVMTK